MIVFYAHLSELLSCITSNIFWQHKLNCVAFFIPTDCVDVNECPAHSLPMHKKAIYHLKLVNIYWKMFMIKLLSCLWEQLQTFFFFFFIRCIVVACLLTFLIVCLTGYPSLRKVEYKCVMESFTFQNLMPFCSRHIL